MPVIPAMSQHRCYYAQAAGPAERRLLQQALLVNAHFQAEAANAGEAAAARDQITAAAAAGNLAVRLGCAPSQRMLCLISETLQTAWRKPLPRKTHRPFWHQA